VEGYRVHLYPAAFVCETVRSGVNTVPLGQAEAARSLGLTFHQNRRNRPAAESISRRDHSARLGVIALTKNTTIRRRRSVWRRPRVEKR